MKTLIRSYLKFYILIGALLFSSVSYSQNIFIENFEYSVLPDISGTGGWFRSGLNTTNDVQVTSPGLTFPGYPGSGVGNSAYLSNVTTGDVVLKDFATVASGAVYYSCLISVGEITDSASADYNIALDAPGATTGIGAKLLVKRLTSDAFQFGVSKLSGIKYSNTTFNTNTTYAAVVKYVFMDGANNDSCMIYIFDSAIPPSEPATPEAFITAGTDADAFGQVALMNAYFGDGLCSTPVKIDGIRVGLDWGSSVLTDIKTVSGSTPDGYRLGQNYPNPFNPTTSIRFNITKPGAVKLKVYDILGNEVASLVDSKLSSGAYSVDFDGAGLSSGVYFYRLETESFSDVKKMTLIK